MELFFPIKFVSNVGKNFEHNFIFMFHLDKLGHYCCCLISRFWVSTCLLNFVRALQSATNRHELC